VNDFHPSARRTLEELRARYPQTSFLALGQTIFWDEPMKAVLCRMLDALELGGKIILGVHDTDYFARVKIRTTGEPGFELMPHNDGSTKDLWSAAGEISRLFGSETFPTRHDFARYGVGFRKAARSYGGDFQEFLDTVTEAWGWRGLVYTGSRDLIVHALPLQEVGDAVEKMLQWGVEGTLESIVDHCCREEARAFANHLLQMVQEYRWSHPNAMLTHLYQHLFPKLFELLLGSPSDRVEVESTTHLLRLTPETASFPRFEFVNLFLHETTRSLATRAYNEAVAGSEIYTLDKFGLGALPCDVILPHHGRGTLRVTLRAIHIETPEPIRIPLQQPIRNVHDLAVILTQEFGEHVTLVGKAVALISMLAREFIFVFNEEGSAYVTRTRRMNNILKAHGVPLELKPILRLKYHTWDALEVGKATLALPDHLATTFHRPKIPATEFAMNWRKVVEEQEKLLEEVRDIRSPRKLLEFLTHLNAAEWGDCLECYNGAKQTLRNLHVQCMAIQEEVYALYRQLAQVKESIRTTERAKGEHYRTTQEWTQEELDKRKAFDAKLSELLTERRQILDKIEALKLQRLAIERGPEASPARAEITRIEEAAELARLQLVRNAILTRTGLTHTQHRPTAWWLPMVDPDGRWFQRIVETTEAYTEPLVNE
jgi:hypothetical protein